MSDEALTLAVQRQMKDYSDELWRLLQSEKSHLYISGKGLEEATSDWFMISKYMEFIVMVCVYIYVYIHVQDTVYPLSKYHFFTVDQSRSPGSDLGEFFQDVAAVPQNWIQLRRRMRQQNRYHCGDETVAMGDNFAGDKW